MTVSRFSIILVISWLTLFHSTRSAAQREDVKLVYPLLVNRFYQQNSHRPFWFAPLGEELRGELINCIDTAVTYDLLADAYHYTTLKNYLVETPADTAAVMKIDRIFTDAAIACMKDLSAGYIMSPWVGYDEVSPKFEEVENQHLLDRLTNTFSATELRRLMQSLEPAQDEYRFLKKELRYQQELGDKERVKLVSLCLNYYRWIHHFGFERSIVVNLASASLAYFEKDTAVLRMKVVAGKPSTPTPCFASWCDNVVLYPYWNVPTSIALNEYLYKFKGNPAQIDALNMQIVDAKGRVVDHHKLDWASFNRGYFPYRIRQSTGCDNALGVIKFNITTPYGVYLHDTNRKTAFFSGLRYYSHGCVRIEEPIALGNYLLNGRLDTAFLQSCYKNQIPRELMLDHPVPVFAIYMPVEASNSGTIRYFKDVYHLLN